MGGLWGEKLQFSFFPSFVVNVIYLCLGAYMVQDSVYCQRVADSLEVAAEREKYDPLKSFLGQLQNEYEGYCYNYYATCLLQLYSENITLL